MTSKSMKRKWGFTHGLAIGALIAASAGVLMAQQRGGPDRGGGEYFVTAAQQGGGARLWHKPRDEERLEFLGDFPAVVRPR